MKIAVLDNLILRSSLFMKRNMHYLTIMLIIVVLLSSNAIFFYGVHGSALEQKENNETQFHTSMYYHNNADFFRMSLKPYLDIKPLTPSPRLFIVNQHILATHGIVKQFALASDASVDTVVIITQNNWNTGKAPIITSQYAWKTPLGDIAPDTSLASSLVNHHIAIEEEDIFKNEHGITGIVPYIAHYFPHAKIVPLVLRDGLSVRDADALAEELSAIDLSHAAIVGTIDMSHYLPKHIANAHDRFTLETIHSFDYKKLSRLDIDTVPTLRVLLKIAEAKGLYSFVETSHSNSADITNDEDLTVTTSYISGYFQRGEKKLDSSPVHMLFVGDMMFDRVVRKNIKKHGIDSLFAHSERLFLGTDLVIGNLEGTVTNNASVSENDYSILRFTFDPSIVTYLKERRITTVSLANNHALDFGKKGYEDTKKNLLDGGINFFGSPKNDDLLTARQFVQGKEMCFIGYHDLFTHDPSPILREIKNVRGSCDFVTVFVHFGEEYKQVATTRQQELAHQFVDTGADLVIGAHPHVVEPLEIYKDKAIFYSLGNFIFDQNFSTDTQQGLTVNVEWSASSSLYTLVPIVMKDGSVYPAEKKERDEVLLRLAHSLSSENLVSDILTKQQFTLWNK